MRKNRSTDVRAWPPEVIVRHATLRSSLREVVEARIERLYTHCPAILRCRATVEGPGRHHRQGHFELRIRITLPGREIEISRCSGENPEEAIREAFQAARRRIQERSERVQRRVKTHQPAAAATDIDF